MKLVTRIAPGHTRQGQPIWVVGVDEDDPLNPIITLPCLSEDQAEMIASAVEKLIAYISGQPDLKGSEPQGSA